MDTKVNSDALSKLRDRMFTQLNNKQSFNDPAMHTFIDHLSSSQTDPRHLVQSLVEIGISLQLDMLKDIERMAVLQKENEQLRVTISLLADK